MGGVRDIREPLSGLRQAGFSRVAVSGFGRSGRKYAYDIYD